jgi:hypothetical protein
MHFSTYREFYQKALLPIGYNDRRTLLDAQTSYTHWVISLEGQPREGDGYYLWEVAIYPADVEGTFDWANPLYRSSLYDCFDEAYQDSRILEQHIHNDELNTMNIPVIIG